MVRLVSLTGSLLALLPAITATQQMQTFQFDASHPPCSYQEPSAEFIAASKEFQAEEASNPHTTKRQAKGILIDVYWHVIAGSTDPADGYLTPAQVAQSIRVLNQNFRPHSISFKLITSYYVQNATWANGDDDHYMRTVRRQGPYSALNVYSKKQIKGGALGTCYLPDDLHAKPYLKTQDGCEINYGTVPNGNVQNFNTGKILTHEVGHWFGLLHPFDGENCAGPNDYVDDTAAMINPPFYCDDERDSCPQQPGNDPWDNYMNYVPDVCKNEFTAGQETRMFNMFSKFRYQGFGG